MPVSNQEMAGFYLHDVELKGVGCASTKRHGNCKQIMEEKDGDIHLSLNTGAKMMVRIYLFDLVQKLSSYHLNS